MSDGPTPNEFDPPPRLKGMSPNDGGNPFREDPAAGAGPQNPFPEGNIYASPGAPSAAEPNRANYEMFAPHRGSSIFTFGIIGLLGATIGSIGLFCCLPFPLFALAASIPAWMMGQTDLKAMNAGAMDISGHRSTMLGYIMGIIATVIVAIEVALFASGMLYHAVRESSL